MACARIDCGRNIVPMRAKGIFNMQLSERRAGTRIAVDIPAQLLTNDDAAHRARICDISRSGMQLRLDSFSIARVLPNVTREMHHLPVEVQVVFDVGTSLEPCVITVHCGVIHVRRVARDECQIGAEFRAFSAGCEELLAAYVQNLGMPADPAA